MPELQKGLVRIALTLRDPDAPVAIMGFLTLRRDDAGGPVYVVPATDESIRAECEKAGLDVMSWRKLLPDEVPEDRAQRHALIDDGTALVVDPAKLT